jgi:hypothetical protein
MRWLWIVGSTLIVACGASQVQTRKLADGSLSFTCELPMEECVRAAQQSCRYQRFRILEGTSETRVRDVAPFEQTYHTSRLRIMCSNDGGEPLLSLDAAKPTGTAQPGASETKAQACSTGETRACIGSGACQGGQACLPDRSGFGPCDCGPTPPAPPAGASDLPAPAAPVNSEAAPPPAAPVPSP